MLQALAQQDHHPDDMADQSLLSHSGGGHSAFIYHKSGTRPDKVYGLRSGDFDVGF
jgi:hypothetical protein